MGRLLFVWSLVLLLLCAMPCAALAGVRSPVPGAVVVAFGATYERDGKRVTHRGLDFEAAGGDSVLAACDGIVTFVGEVPADGGGRTRAVTIRSADGLLLCVSPLAATRVSRGQHVSVGDAIGDLAGSGDGSWSGTHVHLSARQGDTYINPASLFADVAAPATIEAPATVEVPTSVDPRVAGHGAATGATTGISTGVTTGVSVRGVGSSAVAAGAPFASSAGVTAGGLHPATSIVDVTRIRAAYAKSIVAIRSPERGRRASFFGETTFADSLKSPSLPASADVSIPGLVSALAALAGATGVIASRKRLACAVGRIAARMN
ncbi:MAG: M23 family metallopeptidase [Actinomycetota bacterium]|nr:MAG: hypothetical protein FD171_201 [Actinomycetota bacterium]MDO8949481.1 M23 family metallopeptidase [Actinomycetota bacterium]MDP3629990.1 M23 family metallopeptidase [Actinomycetota bacterium]